jgi:hypothetical protein
MRMKRRLWVNVIIALIIAAIYEGIGFLFHIDFLKIMTFTPSSYTISFGAVILCAITAFMVDLIRIKIRKQKPE